jgi:DNA-binding transcriptional MerR regulator
VGDAAIAHRRKIIIKPLSNHRIKSFNPLTVASRIDKKTELTLSQSLPLRKLHISCLKMINQGVSMSATTTAQTTYSISDLSKEFDITTRSIRFYEDQGLLKPKRRGQTRIYSLKDRVRLKLILRGKRLGFSLAETRRLFELYDADKSSTTQLNTMLALVEEKKSALQQQMDDIKLVLMELNSAEQQCRLALEESQAVKA